MKKFMGLAPIAMLFVLASALVLLPTAARAFPEPDGEFFVDLTGEIRGRDKLEIARTLRTASEGAGVHSMLVVIRKMGDYPEMPQNENAFAKKIAEDWKVGEHKTHRGTLALFAIDDRKFAVEATRELHATGIETKIAGSMRGRVTDNLKSGNVSGAMRVAASNIAEALPELASGQRSGGTAVTPTSSNEGRRSTTTTTTTRRRYNPGYSSGSGFFGTILGLALMVFFFTLILRVFSPGGGSYYGGAGYGGGGGGGGFWSGMFTGGMLGWMFGGHSGWGGYNYHGYGGHGGGWSDETTTTTTTTDYSSSSDSSSSYDSSSSSSFDSFGGGDWGGGGSSGEW